MRQLGQVRMWSKAERNAKVAKVQKVVKENLAPWLALLLLALALLALMSGGIRGG